MDFGMERKEDNSNEKDIEEWSNYLFENWLESEDYKEKTRGR